MTKQRLDMTKRLFASLDVYHDPDRSRSAAMNMAIDEALPETAKTPSIRFYRWDHPALSFGYFGKFGQVADYANERDLVRRWTGGGIVFHGNDLTYSLVVPASDPVFSESAISIYEAVHRAICQGLAACGERPELAVAAFCDRRAQQNSALGSASLTTSADRRYSNCFENPVPADVMLNGQKVAGAAQRRTQHGLLQQGSIQLAIGRVRPTGGNVEFGNGFADLFAKHLCGTRRQKRLDDTLLARARELAEQKYETDDWLTRR